MRLTRCVFSFFAHRGVKDQLSAGMESVIVSAVDKILKDCKHATEAADSRDKFPNCGEEFEQDEAEIKTAYAELEEYRGKMKDEFAEQMAKEKDATKDPARLQKLLDDSMQYGESLNQARQDVEAALKSVVGDAITEMKEFVSSKSEDFAAITAALKKYKPYPSESKEALDGLQAYYNEILENTKKMLRELSSSSEPWVIDEQLAKVEVYKETVRDERELVRRRREDIIGQAKHEMQVLHANRSAKMTEIDTTLEKYERWPDCRKEKDQLKAKRSMLLVGTADALNKAASSGDVEELDRALADLTEEALAADQGGKLQEAKANAEEQRETLKQAMTTEMKEAESDEKIKDDVRELGRILEKSNKFGDSIAKERGDLEKYKDKVIQSAKKEIADLEKLSDETAFEKVNEGLAKFSDWPADVKEDVGRLRKRWEALLEEGKSGLLDGCALSDPLQIDEVLQKHERYGPRLDREREQVLKRVETIHELAAKEMGDMAERKTVTEKESKALLDKYEKWGSKPAHADLKKSADALVKARDKLRSKQALMATGTMDRLRRLASMSDDPAELHEALEEFKEREEELGESYTELKARQDSLKTELMDKIKGCKELQDPTEVAKILEEAQAWPDPKAVEKDLKTIQDALKKLYDTVGKDMEKMAGKQPKDLKFEELDETLAKYKKWPDEHKANIKAPLDKLEAKRDELVKEAKDKILELCGQADPNKISEGLKEFDHYGEALDAQRRTAVTRRQFLVTQAQTAIRNLASKKGATLAEIDEMLERFQGYSEQDVGTERLALKKVKTRLHSDQAGRLTDLMKQQPPPVKEIDEALATYAGGAAAGGKAGGGRGGAAGGRGGAAKKTEEAPKLPPELQQAVDELQKYREELDSKEKERLQEAMKLEDPNDMGKVILAAEVLCNETPGGKSVAAEVKKLQDASKKLYDAAKKDMQALAKAKEGTEDFAKVVEALKKYEQWPPELFEAELKAFKEYSDKLIADAKAKLLGLVELQDPKAIGDEIENFRAFGDTVAQARDTAVQRRTELISLAKRSSDSLASDPSASVLDIQKMVRKYEGYGPEIRSSLDNLKATGRRMLTASKDRCAILLLSDDVKAIDSFIEQHTGKPDPDEEPAKPAAGAGGRAGARGGAAGGRGGAKPGGAADEVIPEGLQDEIGQLRERRKELEVEMKKRLADAIQKDQTDPKVVKEALEAAAAYGESLKADVEKAEAYQTTLAGGATDEIKKLVDSENIDDIVLALDKYSDTKSYGDSGVKEALNSLGTRRDELVGKHKMALLELVSKNEPSEIIEGLKPFEGSPAAKYVTIEISAAKQRLNGLIEEAQRTIAVLLHPDRNATLKEIEDMQVRYKGYPEAEMRDKMDALRSKEVLLSSSMLDTLQTLAVNNDFAKIQEAIDKKPQDEAESDAGDEGRKKRTEALEKAYTELEKKRDELLESMKKKIEEAKTNQDADPADILKVVKEAANYGDSVQADRESLEQALEQNYTDAKTALKDLATADKEKFSDVEDALNKYESWPKDQIRDEFDELKAHREKMVDDAKAGLLALCGESSPMKISEEVKNYEAFGKAVDQEYAAALERRKTLVENANDEMQKLTMQADVTVPDIEKTIKKYEELFPEGQRDEIQQSITLLEKVKTNKTETASARVMDLTKSSDILAIDAVLEEYKESELVKEAVAELTKRRDELLAQLEQEVDDVLSGKDPVDMIPLMVKGKLYGESAEKKVDELVKAVTSAYGDAANEAGDLLESDDSMKVADFVTQYEKWPKEPVPDSIHEAVKGLHEKLDGLRGRRDDLVGDIKNRLLEMSTSEDLAEIDKALGETESLAEQTAVERRAAESRREALVGRAKTEMTMLAQRPDTTALQIAQCIQKFSAYPADDMRDEKAGLKAKQMLVFSQQKDNIRKLMDSKDIVIIEQALADPYEGFGDPNADPYEPSPPATESVLKEELAALQQHKESLQGTVKDRLAEYDKLDTIEQLQALLDETQGMDEGLESERKAVEDKRNGIWDEANAQMAQMFKSDDFQEITDGLAKYESYGGPTESRWNQLNLRREELIDSVKIHLIEMMRSSDAIEIEEVLQKYEAFGDTVVAERDSLIERRRVLFAQAVTEMQAFSVRSDVTYADVQKMIEKYSKYPKDDVRVGTDALNLKMRQMYASVGDRLAFLLETKDVAEINQALAESEHLGDEIKEEREKLIEHRQQLQLLMSKRLQDGAEKLEKPADMQMLIDEAQGFGEEVKEGMKALQRRLNIVVEASRNEIKTLMSSDDFSAMSIAVKTYDGFHPDIQTDWEALRARWRREAGNAKSRLQRVASSNDPNEIKSVVDSFASADQLLATELAEANERYQQLIEMANVDMLALARSAEPTMQEIERLLYRYDKYPAEINDSRTKLKKKSDQIAQDIEGKLQVLAQSDSLADVTKAIHEYNDAGERFIHPLATLKKRRTDLLDGHGDRLKGVLNSEDPNEIAKVLEEAEDLGDELRVERAALAKRRRELIEGALATMSELMASDDFREISSAIDKYEHFGDSTRTQWQKLREHWAGQLDHVKRQLLGLVAETEPTVIDAFLKRLDGMDEGMTAKIEGEIKAARNRRDGLIDAARSKMRELSSDDSASVMHIEDALLKFSSYPDMDSELSALEGAKDRAIGQGQEELRALLDEMEDVEKLDAGIAKHRQESGQHLAEMVEDVVAHRGNLMQKLFDQMDEVTYTENVAEMATLIVQAERYGSDATEQVAKLQQRRDDVIANVNRNLGALARSKDFAAVAAAVEKYTDFCEETAATFDAVNDNFVGLSEAATAQLEALAMQDDPALIATQLRTYSNWGDGVSGARDIAERRLDELVREAKEKIREITENPEVSIKEVEEALTKFANYPTIEEVDMVAELGALRAHLTKRVDGVQDELAILRESDDIGKVNAALDHYRGMTPLLNAAVRDLEAHTVGLGRRMADRLDRLLRTEDLGPMDEALDASRPFGEVVEHARNQLDEHRRKILRVAAEEISELTLTDEFQFPHVEEALKKYEDWPEETQGHVQRLREHRGRLVDRVKTNLTALRSEFDFGKIESELDKYAMYGDEILEEREAAQKQKQELFATAISDMEQLATDESADIVPIEEMLAKYAGYPNDVRSARDQLRTRLAVLVAKVKEDLRDVIQSSDFKKVQEQLDRHEKTPSAQIKGMVRDLKERQDNLVIQFCHEMEKGRSLEDIKRIDELLEQAKAYEGLPGIKVGTRALQERRANRIRSARQHIKKMSRSENFADVQAVVDMYDKTCPEDIQTEYEILKKKRDDILEDAKARLRELALPEQDDPSYLHFELEKYEVYGEEVVSEVDDVKARRKELIDSAKAELEKVLTDEATDLRIVGEKLVEYETYPGIETVRMKLQTKRDDMVAAGEAEIIRAIELDDGDVLSRIVGDVSEVTGVLAKHENSGGYLDVALERLEKKRGSLEARLLKRLEDTLSTDRLAVVKVALEDVKPLDDSAAFAPMISEVQTHFDELRKDSVSKIDEALSSQNPRDIAALLQDTSLGEIDDEDVQAKFAELQRHYMNLADTARDKLQGALSEADDSAGAPERMKTALDESVDFKDELKDERKSVLDRRAGLLDSVNAELREVGMGSDFKELGDTLSKYKGYAPETEREWAVLQRRYDEMVENAKQSLRELCGSRDPAEIGKMVEAYEQYGELVDGEREAALSKRTELIDAAKTHMQDLAGTDVDAGAKVKKITDALKKYRLYPDQDEGDAGMSQARDVLTEMLQGVTNSHDELLRAALRSDDVKAVDDAIAKCEQVGLQEQLAGAIADLSRYRFKLQQQMTAKIRTAIQSKDLKIMTDTLAAAEPFGDNLDAERIALESHYRTTSAAIKKELRDLASSEDYQIVVAALQSHEDLPLELASQRQKLELRRDHLLESAKLQLSELAAASTPMHIDEQLPKFDAFGEQLQGERKSAEQRREALCERASEEMKALADAQASASLRDIELCLEKYELYPKHAQVRSARDALRTRQAVKSAKLREQIRDASEGRNFEAISSLLEGIGDSAGSQLSGSVAELREHGAGLLEGMKMKMKASLQYQDPRDIDQVLEEAKPFGDEVKHQTRELTRRRGNLLESINKKLRKLSQVDDVDVVTEALATYSEAKDFFGGETAAEWQTLDAHRENLVERGRSALREMTRSTNPTDVKATIEKYEKLEELVAAEREEAQAHYFKLMDQARGELMAALALKVVDIPAMSEVVDKYKGHPQEIDELRQQLRAKITRAVNTGADAILNALKSRSVTAIDQCLKQFGGTHGNFQEQLSDLRAHRERLLREVIGKMTAAMSMVDPRLVGEVIADAEVWGKEVETERKMLEERRETLRKAAVEDVDAAIKSDDFQQVSLAIRKFGEFADEMRGPWDNLQQVHEDMIDIAKANARDLLSASDPKDIDDKMQMFEYFGEHLAGEREALVEARRDIIQSIKTELLSAVDDPIDEIERALAKYADFTAGDIGRERRRLEAALHAKIALMEERMSLLKRSRNVEEVDLALTEFSPYKSRLEDAFADLTAHRKELIERSCKDLTRALDTEDPKRILDILNRTQPFAAELDKERGALRERYESLMRKVNDELEVLLQSDNYSHVMAALKQQDGHQEALAATVRALEAHAEELTNRCRGSLQSVCQSSDPKEISAVIDGSAVFGENVKELRMEAELRRDELFEIAATDMDGWAHDSTAAPWLLSEILQKYPSSSYPNDERVVRARNFLQEKLAASIASLSETLYAKAQPSYTNVAAIDTLLLTHKKDMHLVPEAYRALQTKRTKLNSSLGGQIKAALAGEDIWEVSKLITSATQAGMSDEKAALEEKREAILANASRELQELKSLDNYSAITEALEKYSKYPHDVGDALGQLQEHARALREEARSYLREQAQRASDPVHLTEVIEKYEMFGEEVEEALHAVRIRRVNLIEAARRELQSMKYRDGLTVEAIEGALEKHASFGDEFKPEIDALQDRISQMVSTVADEAVRSKSSDNVQTVEAALVQHEQLLSRYMPDVLGDLRGFRADMFSTMRRDAQAAVEAGDPREMQRLISKFEGQGFREDGTSELTSLEQAAAARNRELADEIKDLLQRDDYPETLRAIDKYKNQGYASQVEQAVEALESHRDIMRRAAQRRIREATDAARDPKEVAAVIEAHKDFKTAASEQLAEAEARRMALFQDAKTKMQLLLQDPHATIDQMTKIYDQFADFSFEVRTERTNLKFKIEKVTAETEKRLRDATAQNDVTKIDALLKRHAASKEALEPSYGSLVAHRQELTRRIKERVIGASLTMTDPWEIASLLQEAADHGPAVEEDSDSLRARQEHVTDQAIDEMHSLVEQDDNFREITEAVQKYEHYPRVTRSAWQALRQHQKLLLNAAKQELRDAAHSTDVATLEDAIAKYSEYGDEVELLVEAARERENKLYQDAEEAMSTLLHSSADQDGTRPASRDISETLVMYSEYKGPRVDGLRSKLHDIMEKQLRSADLQLRDVMRTHDVEKVDALLRQYSDHGEGLLHIVGEVRAHRRMLLGRMDQQLSVAASSDDPRKLWAAIEASRPFGDDLESQRAVVGQRYSMIVENVIRHIKNLSRSEDYSAVVAALSKYADYPAQEFKHALETLQHHREDLLAAAKGELGRMTRSQDPLEIDAALSRYAGHGSDVATETQNLHAARRQLIAGARREMSRLAASKQSTTTQIEGALERYTNFPVELNDVRRVLIDRLESTRTVKQQLLSSQSAVDPAFILRELQRHESFGPAVDEERAALTKRVSEITQAARIEMENLVRDPQATIVMIERALDKYAHYPDSLADIRAAVSAKFERLVTAMRKDLNRSVGGADIHQLNNMLQQFSGATLLARDVVTDLEQQRAQLCDALVSRMKDALLSPDPVAIADLLEESQAYSDCGDAVAFRRGLSERYRALLDGAAKDLDGARESADYRRVESTLRRYEAYPPEIKPRWLELDAHRNRMVRDVVKDAQAAMSSTSTQTVDALLARLDTFDDKFVSYKQLLHSRKQKLVDDSSKAMESALQTDDILEVDRICSAHVHLVGEVDGAVWKALRDHRQALVTGLRQRVERLLQSHSIVELDAQMEIINVDGLRRELHEDIERLREHRAYLAQEADASLDSAKQACASRSFEVVAAELDKLVGYGLGERPEAIELAARKDKLLAIAKQEMAAVASSSNAHLIAAMLRRFEAYGEGLATERQQLAVCLQRLAASARDELEKAAAAGTAAKMKQALSQSEAFHESLSIEREALSTQLGQLQHSQQEELEAALRSDDMRFVTGVVDKHRGWCTEELRELFAEVEDVMGAKMTAMREALLEALGWTAVERIDDVAQVLAKYRGQVTGLAEMAADWDALEGHYRRLLLAGKRELTKLLDEADPVVVGARLATLSKVEHFAPELRKLRAHSRKLLRGAAEELAALREGNDVVAINVALKTYAPVEGALQAHMDALRSRRAALALRSSDRGLLPGGTAAQGGVVEADGRVLSTMAAQQELAQLLSVHDIEAVEAALVRYPEVVCRKLGGGVLVAVQKLRTHHTVLSSQGGFSGAMRQGYEELKGSADELAKLEADRAQLSAQVARVSHEARVFEEQADAAAAVSNVLALRVEEMRAAAAQLGGGGRHAGGTRRCPACRERLACGAEYKEHVSRCVSRVVEFSVARALRADQSS